MARCNKTPPPCWNGASPCVREAGHGPFWKGAGITPVRKLKRKPLLVEGSWHNTSDGRVWPAGKSGYANREFA
jgi:hypothetical protein